MRRSLPQPVPGEANHIPYCGCLVAPFQGVPIPSRLTSRTPCEHYLVDPFSCGLGRRSCRSLPVRWQPPRHTVFLAPFFFAALSFLLANVDGQKIWAAVVIAALLVGASNTSGKAGETYISKANQNRKLMAAVNHIHQTIPPGGEIFTDYESALMLVYYLCGPKLVLPVGTFNLPASRVKCNGYTIASFPTWNLEAALFLSDFKKMVQAQRLKSGDKIWVFQSGWAVDLDRRLASTSSKFRCLTPRTFGANISVTPFVVDQDLSPAAMVTDCSEPILNPGIN
jgi:hypothetical protein